MLTRRIIPCLDVRNGRVVKGVNFEGLRDVDDPVALARFYNDSGADELVFYDITASAEGRPLFADALRAVAAEVFIPLTVGGSINTLDDFDRVLKCGADKVSVNSGAIRDPSLIARAAKRYGDQCVVLSMDVKRVDGRFHIFARGGRDDTGLDAIDWVRRGVDSGAGEVVVNSIDTDGVRRGFDLEMLRAVGEAVSVPIIASGGAGRLHLPFARGGYPRPQALAQRKRRTHAPCGGWQRWIMKRSSPDSNSMKRASSPWWYRTM